VKFLEKHQLDEAAELVGPALELGANWGAGAWGWVGGKSGWAGRVGGPSICTLVTPEVEDLPALFSVPGLP
jgi:hypothetical protein